MGIINAGWQSAAENLVWAVLARAGGDTWTPVHVCPGTSSQMDLPLSFPVQTGSRLSAICCPWEVGLRAEAWLLPALQWGTCL